ncbi:hypothetical protein K1W54_06235 [Micromonospora sp. CPCC 205371]|nr:hypothetical protein [Micromonospora sp. CPCC 205371]
MLPTATPEEHGVPSSAVMAFLDAVEERIDALHSIVLVRHGHTLARGWWAPYRAELPHTPLSVSKSSLDTVDLRHGYGYQFWRSRHGYRADGAFGQFCLVLPEHDAVVAITSGTPDGWPDGSGRGERGVDRRRHLRRAGVRDRAAVPAHLHLYLRRRPPDRRAPRQRLIRPDRTPAHRGDLAPIGR